MIALGLSSAMTAQIGDPTLEKYVSLGVGGILAGTIFYFYRQLVNQTADRAVQNLVDSREQTSLVLKVVQENSAVSAGLQTMVTSLHGALDLMIREQRDRYEMDLRNSSAKAATDAASIAAAASAALAVVERAKTDALAVVSTAATEARRK